MLALAVSLQPAAAAPLAYFLPGAGEDYREDVPMPSAVLGQHIGDWHLRHDQLITYLRTLAEKSDRVQFEEIGRTHEERPLVILTISTPENLARLEEIRKEHQILSQQRRTPGGLSSCRLQRGRRARPPRQHGHPAGSLSQS